MLVLKLFSRPHHAGKAEQRFGLASLPLHPHPSLSSSKASLPPIPILPYDPLDPFTSSPAAQTTVGITFGHSRAVLSNNPSVSRSDSPTPSGPIHNSPRLSSSPIQSINVLSLRFTQALGQHHPCPIAEGVDSNVRITKPSFSPVAPV